MIRNVNETCRGGHLLKYTKLFQNKFSQKKKKRFCREFLLSITRYYQYKGANVIVRDGHKCVTKLQQNVMRKPKTSKDSP